MDLIKAVPDQYKKYDVGFDKDDLNEYIRVLIAFFHSEFAPKAVLREAQKISDEIQKILPECQMILGSGYPYYVLDVPGVEVPIPEYDRFFGSILGGKVANLDHKFSCPQCVRENSIENFKPFCENCRISVKAFDIIQALPDVDIILVVPEVTEQMKEVVKNYILNNYYNADEDLERAINDTRNFMLSVISGKTENAYHLHPDVMFITERKIREIYESISRGNLKDTDVEFVAFHKNWTTYLDHFAEDLFLSRPHAPLYTKNSELWEYMEMKVSEYVHLGHGVESILEDYLGYLQEFTNGKNYRIATSSQQMRNGVLRRIKSYWHKY